MQVKIGQIWKEKRSGMVYSVRTFSARGGVWCLRLGPRRSTIKIDARRLECGVDFELVRVHDA